MVQGFIRDFLDGRSDRESRVVSLCAGKGVDLLGVLSSHPAKQLVTGRLVELDSDLAAAAREVARPSTAVLGSCRESRPLPLAVADVVQVEVAAALGRGEQRAVLARRRF